MALSGNAKGTKAKYSTRWALIFVSAQIATSQAMRGQAVSEIAGLATIVQNEAEVLWSRKKNMCEQAVVMSARRRLCVTLTLVFMHSNLEPELAKPNSLQDLLGF